MTPEMGVATVGWRDSVVLYSSFYFAFEFGGVSE